MQSSRSTTPHGTAQLVAVGAAVPRAAAVVDVDDGEAARGPELVVQVQPDGRRRRRASVRHDQQGRQLPRQADVVRVRRRVVVGVRVRPSVVGNVTACGIDSQPASTPGRRTGEHLSSSQVVRRRRAGRHWDAAGGTAMTASAPSPTARYSEFHRLDGGHRVGIGRRRAVRAASSVRPPGHRPHAPVRHDGQPGVAEDPLRSPALGGHRRHRVHGVRRASGTRSTNPDRSLTSTSEPSGAQHGDWTDSSGPPATSSGSPGTPSASRSATHSDVPSHGIDGAVPRQPAHPRPVRAHARIAEEVVAGAQGPHVPGGEVDRHQRVDRLALAGVVLADGDDAVAHRVEGEVGEPQPVVLHERRHDAVAQHVDVAIGEGREHQHPVAHRPGAASVLVHARADVRALGSDVDDALPGAPSAHHDPTGLVGP